jgi:hypothetical protein
VETDMHEHPARKGTNWKPLLLIPAAVVIAKGAARRRARWEAMGSGPAGRRHGHGHGFGPGLTTADGREFRLPPKIEAMLEAWHAQAHEQDRNEQEPDTTTV